MKNIIWTESWFRKFSDDDIQKMYQRYLSWMKLYGDPDDVQKVRFRRIEIEWRRRTQRSEQLRERQVEMKTRVAKRR